MPKVIRYELVNIGIEHSQYFQGFGVSHTGYRECAVGIGEDPREALDDVLEQIASVGWDVEALERDIVRCFPNFHNGEACERASVSTYLAENGEARHDDDDDDDYQAARESWLDDCEIYYHIGIRFCTTPNLDDDNERQDFLQDVRTDETLYTDGELSLLREYAIEKSYAAKCRLAGEIVPALESEHKCERIYARLGDCKW